MLRGTGTTSRAASPSRDCYFGGGGTKQVTVEPSTLITTSSSGPVMCVITAPAWPLAEPMDFELGAAPGACVYLTTLPDGNGPSVTPPVTMDTAVPTSDPIS